MRKHWVLAVFVATLACFGLSAALSKLAGPVSDTSERHVSFPMNVLKRYVQKEAGSSIETQKTFAAAELEELQISLISTHVRVELATGTDIEIDYRHGPNVQLDEAVRGATLRLEEQTTDPTQGLAIGILDQGAAELVVRVPANIHTLFVKTVSGDVRVRDLVLEHLELDSVSGDALASGTFAEVAARSVSGELRFEQASPTPQMQLSSTSGDVYLTFGRNLDATVDFSSTSGEAIFTRADGGQERRDHQFEEKVGAGRGHVQTKTISGDARIEILSTEIQPSSR